MIPPRVTPNLLSNLAMCPPKLPFDGSGKTGRFTLFGTGSAIILYILVQKVSSCCHPVPLVSSTPPPFRPIGEFPTLQFALPFKGQVQNPKTIGMITGDVFSRFIPFLNEKDISHFGQATTHCYHLAKEGCSYQIENLNRRALRRGLLQNLMQLIDWITEKFEDYVLKQPSILPNCLGPTLVDIAPNIGRGICALAIDQTDEHEETFTKELLNLRDLRGTDYLHKAIARRDGRQFLYLSKLLLGTHWTSPLRNTPLFRALSNIEEEAFDNPFDEVSGPSQFLIGGFLHLMRTCVYQLPSRAHPAEQLELYKILSELINGELTSPFTQELSERLDEAFHQDRAFLQRVFPGHATPQFFEDLMPLITAFCFFFTDHFRAAIKQIHQLPNETCKREILCVIQGVLDHLKHPEIGDDLIEAIEEGAFSNRLLLAMTSERGREYLLQNVSFDEKLDLDLVRQLPNWFRVCSHEDLLLLVDQWLKPDDPEFRKARITRFLRNPEQVLLLLSNLPGRFWTMPHIQMMVDMVNSQPEIPEPSRVAAVYLRALWAKATNEQQDELRDWLHAKFDPLLDKSSSLRKRQAASRFLMERYGRQQGPDMIDRMLYY